MKLLIDCSSLFHPVKYRVLSRGGSYDDIIIEFFDDLLGIIHKFKTKDIVFFFEGTKKGLHYRKNVYPSYKQQKDKDGNIKTKEKTEKELEDDKESFKRFDIIQDFIKNMGFRVVVQNGCESDDTLAMIVKQEEYKDEKFVMVTSDEDMYSTLTNGNVTLYMCTKRLIYTREMFIQEKGIDPSKWRLVKAIGGCKSDHVQGVNGIGEKKAIAYIKGEMKDTLASYKKIKDFPIELQRRNMYLVSIPIKETEKVILDEDKSSYENFVKCCYDMNLSDVFNHFDSRFINFFEKESRLCRARKKI